MTFSMHDWKRSLLCADVELQPWLRNSGSLTGRIMQRCERFSVQNVKDGKARIAFDESAILKIAPTQLAWSREVFLLADDSPVVFAHSACSIRALQGAWHSLRNLGNRPLGAVLFSHPEVSRQPLHYNALRAQHPLYRRATSVLKDPPDRLWARRSLFYLHGEPLLVTEVFLPGILKLRSEDREKQGFC
jgi:chorismate lyase